MSDALPFEDARVPEMRHVEELAAGATPSQRRTVRVRIAVAVDPSGSWNACGGGSLKEKDAMEFATEVLADGEARYWVTADLLVPETPEIEGTVGDAD